MFWDRSGSRFAGLFFGEENPSDQQTHDGGKLEHDTPDAEKEGNKGFAGGFLIDRQDLTVGAYVMIQKIGEGIDGNGDGEGTGSQDIAFLSHMDHSSQRDVSYHSLGGLQVRRGLKNRPCGLPAQPVSGIIFWWARSPASIRRDR